MLGEDQSSRGFGPGLAYLGNGTERVKDMLTEIGNTKGQTLTVGELRELFARFPDETPVDVATPGWYRAIIGATVQGEDDGFPIIVLDLGDDIDTRAW